MLPSASFIIIAAAIGAVICLFAGDYYYHTLENKRENLSLIDVSDQGDLNESLLETQLSLIENDDFEIISTDSDGLAA